MSNITQEAGPTPRSKLGSEVPWAIVLRGTVLLSTGAADLWQVLPQSGIWVAVVGAVDLPFVCTSQDRRERSGSGLEAGDSHAGTDDT